MKNKIVVYNLNKLCLTIALIAIIGCATTISGNLRFQDREILIHPDMPGLAYPHNETVCVDRKGIAKILGKKCTTKHIIDFYDFNDKAVREKFINGGFSCKSKMRFKY